MVALMLTDEIPNPIAAIIACLLMGKFRCINAESAYKAIHWPSIILIVGMMPFARRCKNRRGGSRGEGTDGCRRRRGALSDARLPVRDVRGDWAVYLKHRHGGADGAYCLSGGEVNGRLTLSFAMVVAMAASAAFMTPVSSPVNTGCLARKYSFSDFVKIGVPFTILVMVVCVLLIPVLFPF